MRNCCIAIGVACLVAFPFYIRNWVLLGSPLYPTPVFLLGIFHPKYLSSNMLYQTEGISVLLVGLRHYRLRSGVDFNLAYPTPRFHAGGRIGLARLAFCPLALLLGWRNRIVKAVALLVWIMATAWFLQQESRFLIPVYAMAAVLAVLGWRGMLASTGKAASCLATAVMAVSLAYGCFMIGAAREQDLHSVVSPSYAQKVRNEQIPFVASVEYLNSTASVRKVLILDRSVPPYYLDRDYLKPIGQWGEQVFPGVDRAADVLPRAKEQGVTHILDVHSAIAPFQVPQNSPGLALVLDLPDNSGSTDRYVGR